MKIFEKSLSECPQCASINWEEIGTTFQGEVMIQIVRCCDCKLYWEERWVFASTVVEDMEEDEEN